MRAISIRQPWAWAVVSGHKNVENKSQRTKYRGPVLVHAAQRFDNAGFDWLDRHGIDYPDELDVGALVGIVEIIDCERNNNSEWAFPGFWHWVLDRPIEFKTPIACSGRLGLFEPPVSSPTVAAAKRYGIKRRWK